MPENQLSILIVEDDLDSAKMTAMLLRIWGHNPTVVHDGQTALTVTEANRPDVILLDLGLPHFDGLKVARAIRKRWPYKPPLLIAVTGYGTTEDRRLCNEAGIDFHLLKPVEPDELRSLLMQPLQDK